MKNLISFLTCLLILSSTILFAQEEDEKKDSSLSSVVSGLKWRSIGPAYTSGRIGDFAVNPENHREYYVAVSSGNIWKTTNAGTTFEPIFDKYGVYSIGCITLDPKNPHVVWTGTGENNHQRALGYGDGVYKSVDGGKSWKNMGLKDSRQIGKIIVHPENSNIVFVAAEGSVWGPGGDRGLFKTTDGGNTWRKVLEISEHTGVNSIAIDPRDPNVLYATSEQRRRHVFTKISGGPESSVYKSVDEGETWDKITSGLPKVDIGGMDIAVSPVNPDVVYLSLEAADKKGGFFRSNNRGATWEKMSDYHSSGQYFNEIFCDPKNVDKVFVMDVVSRYTLDGGKTWNTISTANRHVDDHALWIDPDYTDHYLIGGDGGIYETYDGGSSFHFKENLPVTQFYRVFVDNSLPFYNVFGGTQDNASMGGPSATLSSDGIVNGDWFITSSGDGFWSAVDPEDPNIIYAEAQYGVMVRYDKKSGESISIRPAPGKGELTYKWNWDTPLFISPHNNKRIYCAANFVFRSEDRGDSWTRISEDLTTGLDRNTWKVMDKYWSSDAVAKDKSTSLFGTIVSLTESTLKENLLFAGTDDGLIHVTEDAKTWKNISDFPGVPENTYVSDICASKFDENVLFASFNNLKRDDFTPYILKSIDKGNSWVSITGNLPKNGSVQTIEQDFVNPDLLFAGTEFGIFFTADGGKMWTQLKSGIPTISVKDIAIQQREHDLVVATFGRGFYILDNYSPLRDINQSMLEKDAHVFPVKDAMMFFPSRGRYGQGTTYFKAPNPEFGAVITYYLKDVPKTLKAARQEKEKELFKSSERIPQPSADERRFEKEETSPYIICTITDENGNVVRRLYKAAAKGINRLNWDLRYAGVSPVTKDKFDPLAEINGSTPVLPGKYKAALTLVTRDGYKDLDGIVEFNAVPINNSTLPIADKAELVQFQKQTNELLRTINGTERFLSEQQKRIENIKQAILITPDVSPDLLTKAENIASELRDIELMFNRDSDSPSAEENPPSPVTFNERVRVLAYTHWRSTSNITQNERTAYNILIEEFPPVLDRLKRISNVDIKSLEDELERFNAPWTPGRIPEMKLNR